MTGEMTLSVSSGAVLLGLGAFHGINPAMGWLFAVALGMQERRRSAVWRVLLPLGIGHALAVAAAVAMAVLLGAIMPMRNLRWPVAGFLVVLGVSRLVRHRHPRWVGMRVGIGGLYSSTWGMRTTCRRATPWPHQHQWQRYLQACCTPLAIS